MSNANTMMFPEFGCAPQGWQCPICKRVYSPTTPFCYFCNNQENTYTSTGTGTGDTLKIPNVIITSRDVGDDLK